DSVIRVTGYSECTATESYSLRPKCLSNCPEFGRYGCVSLIPRDPFPFAFSPSSNSFHWMLESGFVIDNFRRCKSLYAKTPLVPRIVSVTFNSNELSIPNVEKNSTSSVTSFADTSDDCEVSFFPRYF